MRPSGVLQALSREDAARMRLHVHRYDAALAVAALALLGLGLVMVASASISIAARELGDPLRFLWRQSIFVVLGVVLALVVLQVPIALWRRASPALLVAGMLLLAIVLVPGVGREVNGSVRWISLGPFNLQPSEPMKLFLALYLAGYLVRRSEQVQEQIGGFVRPIGVLVVISTLLMLEPDYGATVVMFAMALGMLYLGGVPFWSFVGWLGLVALGLGAMVLAAPYRVERLLSFLNPWADPFGSGFQLTQALIAIGRGDWLGVGLGSSVQKLFYLPEAHTDFLFAVLAEELGFAGMLVVILLFAFIVWRALAIGGHAERRGRYYAAYLAYGLGLLVGIQAFVNIGVNMGILPTKGLTLPLMSYGGSSLLTSCAAVALLLRIDHETRVDR